MLVLGDQKLYGHGISLRIEVSDQIADEYKGIKITSQERYWYSSHMTSNRSLRLSESLRSIGRL